MAILQTLPFLTAFGTAGAGAGLFGAMRQALVAAASRRELAQLDDRMLADIGLGRTEALAEADRAPWDLAPRRR
jgi:uncharacterized protein YjiS (DUF1127 family)